MKPQELFFDMVGELMPNWRAHTLLNHWGDSMIWIEEHKKLSNSEMAKKLEKDFPHARKLAFQIRRERPYFWFKETFITEYGRSGWIEYVPHWNAITCCSAELSISVKTGEVISVFNNKIMEYIKILEQLPDQTIADKMKLMCCNPENW